MARGHSGGPRCGQVDGGCGRFYFYGYRLRGNTAEAEADEMAGVWAIAMGKEETMNRYLLSEKQLDDLVFAVASSDDATFIAMKTIGENQFESYVAADVNALDGFAQRAAEKEG